MPVPAFMSTSFYGSPATFWMPLQCSLKVLGDSELWQEAATLSDSSNRFLWIAYGAQGNDYDLVVFCCCCNFG